MTAHRQALRVHPRSRPDDPYAELSLEDLWELHGGSVYALALTLLGDEVGPPRP
jgi:hypothetical protein